MSTKYQIRYNHRSPHHAGSMADAIRRVRSEAGVVRMARHKAADGLYLWKTAAGKKLDSDGSRAFAVISKA